MGGWRTEERTEGWTVKKREEEESTNGEAQVEVAKEGSSSRGGRVPFLLLRSTIRRRGIALLPPPNRAMAVSYRRATAHATLGRAPHTVVCVVSYYKWQRRVCATEPGQHTRRRDWLQLKEGSQVAVLKGILPVPAASALGASARIRSRRMPRSRSPHQASSLASHVSPRVVLLRECKPSYDVVQTVASRKGVPTSRRAAAAVQAAL